MSHNPGKKTLKKNRSASPFAGIRLYWLQISPVLLFGLAFAVLMILFYLLWLSEPFKNNIHPHIVSVNAKVSGFILNLFGMATTVMNSMISSNAVSVDTARG